MSITEIRTNMVNWMSNTQAVGGGSFTTTDTWGTDIIPNTAVPYSDGTSTAIPWNPIINPFVTTPPFIIPFDHDMVFIPKDKTERRKILMKELEALEEPIMDMPKRPYRHIVRPEIN